MASHLRVYRFPTGAAYEGGLVGAIERLALSDDTHVLDALFVRRDAVSGALEAVDLTTSGARATLASLLDFRLDPVRRRALTERTLTEHQGGVPRTLIETIGGTLEPGGALLAVLHTKGPPRVLDEAAARVHGSLIADEPVEAGTLAQVGRLLRAAVGAAAAGD